MTDPILCGRVAPQLAAGLRSNPATKADCVERDVVIVGGGVAGSVLAMVLARAGISVAIVERKTFPRRKVCGCCLNARAIAGLQAAGLSDAVNALQPVEHEAFSLWANGRHVALPMPRGWAVSRAALDLALLAAAQQAGTEVVQPATASVLGVENARRRVRVVAADDRAFEFAAKMVIVADGLGHPSLKQLPELGRDGEASAWGTFSTCPSDSGNGTLKTCPTKHSPPLREVADGSRVGAGCEISYPAELAATLAPNAIHMLVSREGYVGLTQVENGSWNIAAAFDREAVKRLGGLGPTAMTVAQSAAGQSCNWSLLAQADWSGTPELTRTSTSVAFERLFLIGDAAGYVEPFTGEGMATAIDSALVVSELVQQGVRDWKTELAVSWSATQRDMVRRRSWLCRGLARLLRSPLAVRGSMAVLQHWPGLARPIMRKLNESERPASFAYPCARHPCGIETPDFPHG